MSSEAESDFRFFFFGVSRIEALYSKWAEKQGLPMHLGQVFYILKFSESVTQKQISEICEMPKQTVNNVIRQLKANKYITLVANKEDKREKKIKLTPRGKIYIDEFLKPSLELNKAVFNRVGANLLSSFSKAIKTMGDALELEIELRDVTTKLEKKQKNAVLI
jgi:DNA-binding MarR family transcriptional regulator